MTLAYDFPLLGVFWTMLAFFLLVAWWMAVFYVVVDIFRSNDLTGIQKALWFVFVFLVPLIGVATYVLVRGDKIADRGVYNAEARDARLQRPYERMA
jgi:hypothetical protein